MGNYKPDEETSKVYRQELRETFQKYQFEHDGTL
jgi:hypothetical protein